MQSDVILGRVLSTSRVMVMHIGDTIMVKCDNVWVGRFQHYGTTF